MRALISSSYVNAYYIFKGLSELGIQGFTLDRYPSFPIPSSPQSVKADYLFFTEEASLRLALNGVLKGNYLPRHFPLNLLDDKWEFAEWLKESPRLPNGVPQWSLDDCELAAYPCLLKAKHSWVDGVKLPRGWICGSKKVLCDRLADLVSSGFNQKDFFIQQWLGDSRHRLVSVCGFFDSQNHRRNLVSLVERIASHGRGLSCSSAVQVINDSWSLVEKTALILDELQFVGPFEIEYLVLNEHEFVLELNPRFWMQHSIFLQSGNALLKRYLGVDNERDHEIAEVNNIVWVDGVHFLKCLFRLELGFPLTVLRAVCNNSLCVAFCPSVDVAALVLARLFFRRLRVLLSEPRSVSHIDQGKASPPMP